MAVAGIRLGGQAPSEVRIRHAPSAVAGSRNASAIDDPSSSSRVIRMMEVRLQQQQRPVLTFDPINAIVGTAGNRREMEILRLLSAGKSLSEIAWLVHSSYKTVANTSSIMRQKLGVRTSAELVRLAIDNGVA